MDEVWQDIPGYEGLYEASTAGQIRSKAKLIKNRWGSQSPRGAHILKPEVTNGGYHRVVFCHNRSQQRLSVHRIIILTFVGPGELDQVVNHKDGNPGNNRLDNLEYVTTRENILHAITVLGHYRFGAFNNASKLTDNDVREIRQLFSTGQHTKRALGKIFNVSEVLIGKIVRREIWQHVA